MPETRKRKTRRKKSRSKIQYEPDIDDDDIPKEFETPSQNYFQVLPQPIIKLIFEYFNMRQYPTLSLVCKDWDNILWSSMDTLKLTKFDNLLKKPDELTTICIKCYHLTSLTLQCFDMIDDDSVRTIVKHLTELRYLDLGRCGNITEKGVNRLAASQTFRKQLSYLNLDWTYRITPSGLAGLASLTSLQTLSLKGHFLIATLDPLTQIIESLTKLKQLDLRWCVQSFYGYYPCQYIEIGKLKEFATRKAPKLEILYQTIDSATVDIPNTMVEMMTHGNDRVDTAARKFRQLLSMDLKGDPPIDSVLSTGVLPYVVNLLRTGSTSMQLTASWILTNICSGTSEHTKEVVDNGAIPAMIDLLETGEQGLKEQILWTFGNIFGDSPQLRDILLQHGILYQILNILKKSKNPNNELLNLGAFCLTNVFRQKPLPPVEMRIAALPVLSKILKMRKRPPTEALADIAWTFGYLSDSGTDDMIFRIVRQRVVPKLIELMATCEKVIVVPCLRTIGNIASADNSSLSRVLVDNGVLPVLKKLLSTDEKNIRREVCWTVSNIAAENDKIVSKVVEEGFFSWFTEIMMDESESIEVRCEAGFAVCNGITGSTVPLVNYFFKVQAMKAIVHPDLARGNPKICNLVLQSLKTFLHTGLVTNDTKFWEEFKRLDAKKYVERLEYEEEAAEEAKNLLQLIKSLEDPTKQVQDHLDTYSTIYQEEEDEEDEDENDGQDSGNDEEENVISPTTSVRTRSMAKRMEKKHVYSEDMDEEEEEEEEVVKTPTKSRSKKQKSK